MTADVSSLVDKVRTKARAVNDAGIANMVVELEIIVPDDGQAREQKLRTSRTLDTFETADTFTTVISYYSDTAEWTEYGTTDHEIAAHRPPWALHFTWPAAGGSVFFSKVHWRPGPGVARNIGWFSRTLARWPDLLAAAAERLG